MDLHGAVDTTGTRSVPSRDQRGISTVTQVHHTQLGRMAVLRLLMFRFNYPVFGSTTTSLGPPHSRLGGSPRHQPPPQRPRDQRTCLLWCRRLSHQRMLHRHRSHQRQPLQRQCHSLRCRPRQFRQPLHLQRSSHRQWPRLPQHLGSLQRIMTLCRVGSGFQGWFAECHLHPSPRWT